MHQNTTDRDEQSRITQKEKGNDDIVDDEITITRESSTIMMIMMLPRRIVSSVLSRINTIFILFTPFINRCLQQTVVADKLSQYSLLNAILLNGKFIPMGFLVAYILFLSVIWIPLWVLAQLISEWGVYLLLMSCIIFGGRCLLRLLAFPGTNVRVYGEIEKEFAKYSCKMLVGASNAMEKFATSLLGFVDNKATPSSLSSSSNEDEGMNTKIYLLVANYNRAKVYKNQVLGVFWEVMHCLYEDHGEGSCRNNRNRDGSGRNGLYHVVVGEHNTSACSPETCKRKCKRTKTRNYDEDIGEDSKLNDNLCHSLSTIDSGSFDCQNNDIIPTTSTRYGNNPLVGDVGNLANLSSKARSDGRELYTLIGLVLEDICTLESLANDILQNLENENMWNKIKISKETVEFATKVIERAAELREFVRSRIKVSSDTVETNENEDEVGVDAVRHRLEERGNALSSSSVMGMVSSAVQALVNMIDPPPHDSIFGLDVVRGCFLARYAGAKQFWVKRIGNPSTFCGGNGQLDVVMVPSFGRNSEFVEDVIPLSPRKDRNESVTSPLRRADGINKMRKAVLYCNPNAGLLEVATGMGLIGGNAHAINDDDDTGP